MSRTSTIGVIFEAQLDRARADYEAFRAYVESHPVRVRYTTDPGTGGGDTANIASAAQAGTRTVQTFGGQAVAVSTAPPVVFPSPAVTSTITRPSTAPAVPPTMPITVPLVAGMPAGYVPPGQRRPLEVISQELGQNAGRRGDPARYAALMDEFRGSYGGATPEESAAHAKLDRTYERESRRAARAQEREEAKVARAEEIAARRVDATWDAAGLSAQKAEERQTAREAAMAARDAVRAARDAARPIEGGFAGGADTGRGVRMYRRPIGPSPEAGFIPEGQPQGQLGPGGYGPPVPFGFVPPGEGAEGGGRAGQQRLFGLRLGRVGQLATVGIIAHEALRATQAAEDLSVSYQIARGNPYQQVAADLAFHQAIGSIPIVGAAALLGAHAIVGDPRTNLADAQRGMDQVSIRSAGMIEERQIGHTGDAYHYATVAAANTDPYQRRMAEIRAAQFEYRDKTSDEYFRRQEEINNEIDPTKRAAMEGTFRRWKRVQGNTGRQFDAMQEQQAQLVRREEAISAATMGVRTTGQELGRAGFQVGAGIAQAREQIMQYLPRFNAQGMIVGFGNIDQSSPEGKQLAEEVTRSYTSNVAGVRISYQQQIIERQGNLEASRLTRGGHPLEGQIHQIHAAAAARRKGVTSQAEIDLIFDEEKEAVADARREWNYDSAAITVAQRRTTRSVMRRLQRDPTGAEAAEIGESGVAAALTYQRAGRADRAQTELSNTSLQLDLLRQNYTDSFRGTQVDLRNIDTQGPLDREDPVGVLREILEEQKQLPDKFKEAIAEATAG